MAKLELIMLKGLPGSSKTTAARKLAEDGYYRISKDDIRESLFGDSYKRKHEKQVIWTRDALIREALSRGKPVVSDDTNLNPVHQRALKKIAEEFSAGFVIDDSFLEVPLEECIKRDLKRDKSVGERVIREMYEKYIRPAVVKTVYNPDLDCVYLVDLDGSLSIMGDRSPYDWHKVGIDDINTGLSHVLDGINEIGYAKIFIFSGRDSVCRPETEEWLNRHGIQYDLLKMRPEGDTRPDTVIKKEMYDTYVKGQYNVLGVYDDRPVICEQYRQLGLNVFQMGSPYIFF